MTYDIYSMMLLLRDTTFRCEREEKVSIICHDDDNDGDDDDHDDHDDDEKVNSVCHQIAMANISPF